MCVGLAWWFSSRQLEYIGHARPGGKNTSAKVQHGCPMLQHIYARMRTQMWRL
jgi:hypothetical protein